MDDTENLEEQSNLSKNLIELQEDKTKFLLHVSKMDRRTTNMINNMIFPWKN